MYVSTASPADYIELREDGSFILQANDEIWFGAYEANDTAVLLKSPIGRATRYNLFGDSVLTHKTEVYRRTK
jgi:hypothetical protein